MKKLASTSFRTFYLLLILPSFLFIAFAQTSSKAEKIDELMNKYTDYLQFNGSVLVAEDGEVILKKGYGMANMEWNIPNSPETKHRLGSITKQFTSMLIMQLVDEGKLDLDKPVTTYLKDYPKETGDKISIHHLLTHTSGIPNYTSFPGFFQNQSRNPYTPKEFVKVFADSSLVFNPGEKFEYSNSGYFLLGVIIEEVTGKSYEENLKERIFDPLKMNDTGFDHHDEIIKNRATGYEQRGTEFINSPYLDMSIPYSAGSLYSTVEDLYKWDRALKSNKILSEESKKLMFTMHKALGPLQGAGYGWYVGQQNFGKDTVNITGHGGGINGFNTLITRIPEDDNLIILLNNTGGKSLNEMTTAISNIIYGNEYQMPRKSGVMALLKEISENGMESGLEFYNKFKDDETYNFNEGEMNSLGYQLLRSGKNEAAIEVFKLNVKAYPKSGNVYDSLGEAYLKNGNKKLALENYKKSVQIDPNNTNGLEVIKDLENNTD
ncbi:serine hydrolase [Christiangramia sp. SM2212]|uniref:Serine hydrolase n=1 Tax=Christiangramia sediminicola TaxID=3073267 RepID=A0ABU1ES52_9FLAO|nr:serine hydrolase [Christiangramia sp. SM2212]MDR5591201.1 serine hydrolase [Christiangramia sp. SM2212]